MFTPSSNRARLGFSLIELMVCIGIIAVMIAVLFPALTKARETAKRVTCMSNMRQIGLYTHYYIDANAKGYFPTFFFDFSPGNSGTIVILVQPKKAATSGWSNYQPLVMTCPADIDPGTVPVLQADGVTVKDEKMSYGFNIDLQLKLVSWWTGDAATPNDGFNPARYAVFFDGSMSGSSGHGKNIQGHYFGSSDFAQNCFTTRHVNSGNVLFGDWHVEPKLALTDDMISGDLQFLGLTSNGNANGNSTTSGGTTSGGSTTGSNGNGNGNGNGHP
jgi:prepilin-type N-terminal cleavage/methylation domain-containing protein/prepilin-type processing-associated H-X9-DG protein